MIVTESVLKKLKRDLKENQKEAVKFISISMICLMTMTLLHGWKMM